MHDDFVESRHAREWAAVFFPFLHGAFAVGGADNDSVVVRLAGHPAVACAPERPSEIAASVVDVGVIPGLAVVETQFHTRDAAAASECDALHLDGPAQFA